MRIEAAIFDIDGTLLDGRPNQVDAAMEGLRAAHGILSAAGAPLPDFHTTFALVQREMTRAAASMAFGNYRESSIPSIVRGFVSKAFPGAPESAVEEALEAWYAPFGAPTEPARGAIETLASLKARGYKLAAAGNSAWGSRYVSADLERAGLLRFLDTVTCSADVGFRKPNLFLLEHAIRSIGVRPESAIHVGDDPREDVEAPQEAGMFAILLGRPGARSRADLVLDRLDRLPEELDRLCARRDGVE